MIRARTSNSPLSQPCGRRGIAVPGQQRGAALIVALVILVILTSMGVAGMRTANLEEQFSGNVRDRSRAFGAAEAALRGGEDWLDHFGDTHHGQRPSTCTSAPCEVFATFSLANGFYALKDFSWWASNARDYTAPGSSNDLGDNDGDGNSTLSAQPKYIVEEIGFVRESVGIGRWRQRGLSFYRVSALGQGGSQHTNVVLQSTFAKRFY